MKGLEELLRQILSENRGNLVTKLPNLLGKPSRFDPIHLGIHRKNPSRVVVFLKRSRIRTRHNIRVRKDRFPILKARLPDDNVSASLLELAGKIA